MTFTHDISDLKRVPIREVALRLGVQLVRTGGDTWQEKEAGSRHNVTSLTIFEKTNSFVRFSGKEQGGVSKGSVIDFVRYITENPDVKTACEFLEQFL